MADPYNFLNPNGGSHSNPTTTPAGQWFRGMGLNIRGTNENPIMARMLAAAMMPQIGQQLQLGNELQARMPGLANQFDPGSRQHLIARGTNAAFSNASRANRQSDAAARGAGIGSGMRAGATQGAFNAAATQGNALSRHYNSPEFATQTMQMFQQFGLNPTMAGMLASLIGGQPFQQPQQQPGGLGSILGLVGQLAGGGAFNGLFR